MKYFTRTLEIKGTLTIGVAAENLVDARKIFKSIIANEDYILYSMHVEAVSFNKDNDKEISRKEHWLSDCCIDEQESQEILHYVNNGKEAED